MSAVLIAGGVAGCGDAPRAESGDRAPAATPGSASAERPARSREDASAKPPKRRRRVARVACPGGITGCRSVAGRIVYVERVDPDGDGDLHVVLAGRASVTGPGLTSVDIAPALRPRRDPRPGDLASAAGPVQRGSVGQRQLHAVAVRLCPARASRSCSSAP